MESNTGEAELAGWWDGADELGWLPDPVALTIGGDGGQADSSPHTTGSGSTSGYGSTSASTSASTSGSTSISGPGTETGTGTGTEIGTRTGSVYEGGDAVGAGLGDQYFGREALEAMLQCVEVAEAAGFRAGAGVQDAGGRQYVVWRVQAGPHPETGVVGVRMLLRPVELDGALHADPAELAQPTVALDTLYTATPDELLLIPPAALDPPSLLGHDTTSQPLHASQPLDGQNTLDGPNTLEIALDSPGKTDRSDTQANHNPNPQQVSAEIPMLTRDQQQEQDQDPASSSPSKRLRT